MTRILAADERTGHLACETKADLILLDETLGRRAAQRLGLKVIGTLGVLIEAKDRGLLDAIKPALDDLRSNAGFHIGDELYDRVLEAAHEFHP